MMPLQTLWMSPNGRLVDVSTAQATCSSPSTLAAGSRPATSTTTVGSTLWPPVRTSRSCICTTRRTREPAGHFIVLRLEGTKSNRDGVGATVTIQCGERQSVAMRYGGGSYQSANDPRLSISVSARAEKVDRPRGPVAHRQDRQLCRAFDVDTGYLLREGGSTAVPLQGFGPR